MSLNVADPDLWGHVTYGRDALARGLPATTTYSYVAEGYPWINHEIIAEYALALGADYLGGPGLLVVKSLFGLVVIGLMLRRARAQGSGLIAACGTVLLVAVALGTHWSLRPQLFSYVGFTLLLAILSAAFAGWEGRSTLPLGFIARFRGVELASAEPLTYSLSRMRLLWLVPLVMMAWTNAHGGFLAGLCVYLAYLGLRGGEALFHKGRAADGLVLRFALMGGAAILATFVNPYSFRFHAWLYHDLAVPRPEITEWRPPDFADPQSIPLILLLGLWLACLALSRRKYDLVQQAILGLILWQSLAHVRHVAFLVLAFGWWMPVHIDSALKRLGIGAQQPTAPPCEPFSASLSPLFQRAFALLLLVAISLSGGQLAWRLGTLKVDRNTYPVSAFEFIAANRLTGKLVVTFNWAQYALAAFGPQAPGEPGLLVQIDGRCRTSYSQEMLDMHFDFILGDVGPDQRYRGPASGPFDSARSLHFGRPDLVLIARGQEPSVAVMNAHRDQWVLLYQDELAQLWGRSAKYGDPTSAHFISPQRRTISDAPQTGYVLWPAIPSFPPADPNQLASSRS